MRGAAVFGALVATCAAGTVRIANGTAEATVTGAGLTAVVLGGVPFGVAGDGWALTTNVTSMAAIDPRLCGAPDVTATSAQADVVYTCSVGGATVAVAVTYQAKAEGYLVKRLAVHPFTLPPTVAEVTITGAVTYAGAVFTAGGAAPTGMVSHSCVYGTEVAGFVRFNGTATSLFASSMSPFGQHTLDINGGVHVTSFGAGPMAQHGFAYDGVVVGAARAEGYPNPSNVAVYDAEARAVRECVAGFLVDGRKTAPTVVNVAWDENDYQIDWAGAGGRAAYGRILAMNKALGIGHVVMEPQNTQQSSRFNFTDDWGWEASLWLSMGEKLRAGVWDPRTDPIPEEVLAMGRAAAAAGVKIMAYVYPAMCWAKWPQFHYGAGAQCVDIGEPAVKEWLQDVLVAFARKMGPGYGGFAWDHDIQTYYTTGLDYRQHQAWMDIRAALAAEFPGLVMDNRYAAHLRGPWYSLAPSYSEPLAGDENPETYGAAYVDFHTDRVTCAYLRQVNYKYMLSMLLPQDRVPGFVSHQTERASDNGTSSCFGGVKACWAMNVRDFDLLGYRQSLLSTIGTAALNIIWAMVPARDVAEFEFFPQADRAFIKYWHGFARQHAATLRRTHPIPYLAAVELGKADGTHAIKDGEGFVFLFVTGYADVAASLRVDASLGLDDVHGVWTFTEVYPHEGRVAGSAVAYGENLTLTVPGNEAVVLQVAKAQRGAHAACAVGVAERHGAVRGRSGHHYTAQVRADGELVLNGVACTTARPSLLGEAWREVDVLFAGGRLATSMPAAVREAGGGWVNITATITPEMWAQLQGRAAAYPVPWSALTDDYDAPWLVPSRLPLFLHFTKQPAYPSPVAAYVNGAPVELIPTFTSRGLRRPKTFTGWYIDFTAVAAAAPLPVAVAVDLRLGGLEGFVGAYWENIVAEETDVVARC